MQSFTLSVPCKPYIQKYFSVLYGPAIILDHSTEFGVCLINMIQSNPLVQQRKSTLRLARQHNNSRITFHLTYNLFYRLPLQLTEQQEFYINRYLEKTFAADFCNFVSIACFFGMERKDSIETFCAKHSLVLEEDITYEALKKAEYRRRKAGTARNIFLSAMSPQFAPEKRA